MAGVDFDFSAPYQLAADMERLAAETIPAALQAVEHTARGMKDDWRAAAQQRNRRFARRYPASIDYDVTYGRDGVIRAEIGPNLSRYNSRQAFLATILESGAGIRNAPQHNADVALRNNLADFETGIMKALGEL